MIVDFHVHSTASDGTCSPAELAAKAQGFAAIALTDHDNCDGVVEFLRRQECRRPALNHQAGLQGALNHQAGLQKALNHQAGLQKSGRRHSCRRVAGIELSIEPGEGFDKFHLLGLGIDPANENLKAFLKRILDGRNARNARILANFRRLGIEMEHQQSNNPAIGITLQSDNQIIEQSNNPNNRTIFSYAHGEVLARPHFARWLVDHGFAADLRDAFARYLLPDSPSATRCYEERWHPTQEDAFRTIHEAGGICVMAHPKYWRADWKTAGPDYAAAERELAALRERGLDGVESLYQANTNEENVAFTQIATRLGYLRTAGSDFHGANKPTIPLGMEVSESFIGPVLERLNMV